MDSSTQITDPSFSNLDLHGRRTPARTSPILYLLCQNIQTWHSRLWFPQQTWHCISQWKFSGLTSRIQLKDQTTLNNHGSQERPQEGSSSLLFLHLQDTSSVFFFKENIAPARKGGDACPAHLLSSRTCFCWCRLSFASVSTMDCKTPGNNCWSCSETGR